MEEENRPIIRAAIITSCMIRTSQQSAAAADVGGKTHDGCSARNRNNPDNNFNDNNGVRVAVSTLLAQAVSQPEMPGGYAFRVEVRNGGVLSRPCYRCTPEAGQIATGRVSSVRP